MIFIHPVKVNLSWQINTLSPFCAKQMGIFPSFMQYDNRSTYTIQKSVWRCIRTTGLQEPLYMNKWNILKTKHCCAKCRKHSRNLTFFCLLWYVTIKQKPAWSKVIAIYPDHLKWFWLKCFKHFEVLRHCRKDFVYNNYISLKLFFCTREQCYLMTQ